jgi:hypothetical protein
MIYFSRKGWVIIGLVALTLIIAISVGVYQSNSAQRSQDQINHSTDDWQCILNYGDQSDC